MKQVSPVIQATATALEWDYRTDQAKRCCEEAFYPLRGEDTPEEEIIGFQQHVKITEDGVDPISSYRVVTYKKDWLGDEIIELLPEDVFSSVSKAVFSSHLGNQDTVLHSRIESITQGGWPIGTEVDLTVLRDLMIFTPRDFDPQYPEMGKNMQSFYALQQEHHYPAVCVIIVPPVTTNHEKAQRLGHLIHATEVGRRLLALPDLSLTAPLSIHPYCKETQ